MLKGLGGFGGLGNLGQFAGLMKYAPEIPGRIERIKTRIQAIVETGTTDCGTVVVEASGLMQILSVRVENAITEEERAAHEEMVRVATNDALRKVRLTSAEIIQEETSDMDIPGLGDMLGKMSGMI